MSMNDPLAAAMSKIGNAEKLGRQTCAVASSNIIKNVLALMNEKMYLGEFAGTYEPKGGILTVNLLGRINKCGAIKPRFSIKKGDY